MDVDTSYYSQLADDCEYYWRSLANSITNEVPVFICNMFDEFVSNPLCIAIAILLLAVAGFALFRLIVRSISDKR